MNLNTIVKCNVQTKLKAGSTNQWQDILKTTVTLFRDAPLGLDTLASVQLLRHTIEQVSVVMYPVALY